MSQKQAAVLAGLAIAVVSISACQKKVLILTGPGAGHHYGQKQAREFRVYIYTDPQDSSKCWADLSVVTLWKDKQQTVTWISDDGNEYTVDFDKGQYGSPFSQTTFDIPAGHETPSGSLNSTASGYYDFAIYLGKGGGNPCKDPGDPGYYVK
jgi:hypothetical protein